MELLQFLNSSLELRIDRRAIKVWIINGMIETAVLGLIAAGLGAFVKFKLAWPWWLWAISGLLVIFYGVLVIGILPGLRWQRWSYEVSDQQIDLQRGVWFIKRTLIPMIRLVSREPESGKQNTVSENVKVFSNRDLLIFGITSGGSFGIAFSFLSGGFAIIDDLNYSKFSANNLLNWIWESGYILYFAAGVLAGIWLLALAGIVAYYGGFTITRTEDRLQITHGFLQRRQVSIPIRRIQAICLVEGILRQPFGFVALRVESAGFAVKGGKKLLLWPLLYRDQVTGFLEQYVPEFAQNFELNSLSPDAGRRYAFGLVLPLALVVLPLSWWFPWGKYALPLLPLSLLWGLWRYRDAGWGINGDMLALRFRILNRTTALIPRRCAQSFTISVSPLQRRAGLTSFNIPLASGTAFGLVHISKFDGDKLLKWVSRLGRSGQVPKDKL